MRTKIYAPRENHWIRYVGKTKYLLKERLSGHLIDARRGNKTYKCNWIRSMLLDGRVPRITLPRKAALARVGLKRSPDFKRKMSLLSLGRVFSPVTRKKISDSLKGRKLSPEVRQHHIQAMGPRDWHGRLMKKLN